MGTLSNFILVILDIVCLMFTMKRSTGIFGTLQLEGSGVSLLIVVLMYSA
jgi:hypothetical protein